MSIFSNRLVRAAAVGVVGLGVAFTAMGPLREPASATPVSRDLLAPGDGLLTFDPDSKLEWLDLTLTLNRSFTDVAIDGFGGFYDDGFVHATTTQVGTLFGHAGITNIDGAISTGIFDEVRDLMALVGITENAGLSNPASKGIAFNNPGNSHIFVPFLQINTQPGPGLELGRAGSTNLSQQTLTAFSPTVGSWLIRDTVVVPLPPALPLFGTGLGILGILGWRRRRKAA